MLRSQLLVCAMVVLFGRFISPACALEPSSDPILRIETGGHLTNISDAATDKAGKLIATASGDKTVRLWPGQPLVLREVTRVSRLVFS